MKQQREPAHRFIRQASTSPQPVRRNAPGGDVRRRRRRRRSHQRPPGQLCHRILSFLKAWEAVRTSALSRRWRHVWTTAPCLDIRHPCACDDRADQERYGEFVKNLLLKRRALNAPLDTLRLRWSHDGNADTWIAYAVRREARVIELSGKNHRNKPEPEYTSFVSERRKILKLTHVTLDGHTLTGLCSRSTSLEELELKNCVILGSEIRSTLLKRFTIVNCFVGNGLLVDAPNLVVMRCIRPYISVPQIENSGSLVTATIMLDDSCLDHRLGYHEWALQDDDDDDDDDDNDFFTYAAADDSESDYDDDSSSGAGAEDSDGINDGESDNSSDDGDDYDSPELSESGDKKINDGESDQEYDDSDDYDGPELSESGDKKGDDLEEYDDRTVAYGEIADECSSKDGNDGPSDYCGGDDGSNNITIYAGDGILHSLSTVRTMDLLAHPGEVVLRRELKKCPMFKNLKTLSLGEWCIAPDLDALSTILEHSPNLENLFLHLDMKAYDSRNGINPRERSFACSNLKMVKITCSKDDTMVHKLAKFFRTNNVPFEKIFVRRTANTRNGKGGRLSRAKRKAHDEAVMILTKLKLRKLRKSPEWGKGGKN